jgi:membrane-associated phospholipid phosphatase
MRSEANYYYERLMSNNLWRIFLLLNIYWNLNQWLAMNQRLFGHLILKGFRKTAIIFLMLFPILSLNAQKSDIRILRQINLERNRNLDNTFEFISATATPVSIILPIAVIGTGLKKKDKEQVIKGITIGSGILLASIVSTSLKYSIKRPRPFETYPDIDKATYAGSPSFPSGHTSDAFSTATGFSLAYPKWYVIAPSYTWACAVGYSRMHLGVHYPSDVLAGAIIGSLSAYLCYRGQKWISSQRK